MFEQDSPEEFEVILVNNGFPEARAGQLQANYPKLRIIEERTPGLAHARRAGFRAARGEFFVCIDDDNILENGFLRSLLVLIAKHPKLGCICPVVVPRWEQKPAEWLQEFGVCCLSYTAVAEPGVERKEQVWLHPNFKGWPWPPGGGMIIHRSIAENYLESGEGKRLNFGRVGKSLGGCEDQDIYLRLPLLGRNAAYSENLLLYHQIPASRIEFKYLFILLFRSTQDWAVLQRLWRKEMHPFAMNDLHWHLREFLRLPYVWVRVWIRTKHNMPRFALEWASHAGYLWGWFRDWSRDFSRRSEENI